ncbi:MAG: class I SAM-dependent methyltransferase [Sulfurospirillaceae bacterium]|nr:class I SAM-dependent methyltransferase [Sulfurospirillaceae bacterium]
MKSTIEAVDFNLLYTMQKFASSHKKKDVGAWDEKASQMNLKIHEGYYNDVIDARVILSSSDTLLDIGCGPGTFSLRFAPKVKEVYAFDFSPKMLEILAQNAKEKGINNISHFCCDMEGSWENVPVCDVVLASRCLEVDDLQKVLQELDTHAKKAVYVTFKVGKSYLNEEILKIIKRDIVPKPDYIYVLNTLYNMGILATVDFIFPKKCGCIDSTTEEEYIQALLWSLDGITPEEEALAREYFLTCKAQGKNPALRDNRWAFISWKK